MKYIIMECKLGYAIAMDSDGRFQKVVNLDYEVGQQVDEVLSFEMEDTQKRKKSYRTLSLAIAACLCLFFYTGYANLFTTYGAIRMQINPDVLIEVNKLNYVIDIEGLNDDGEDLIKGYSYHLKKMEIVSDELADRAIEMGYLTDGGDITIEIQSEHDDWKVATEEQIIIELTAHLNGTITVHTPHDDSTEIEIPINSSDDVDDDIDDDSDDDTDDDDSDDDDDNDSDDDDDDDDDDD